MNKRTPSSDRRHTRTRNGESSPVSTSQLSGSVRRAARRSAAACDKTAVSAENLAVRFRTDNMSINFNIDPTAETVWASQKQIADLFGVDRTVVSRHLKNLFEEGELDAKAVSAKNARTASDGKVYEIREYDLDAILGVGYRISSRKATAFRRWANEVLRSYIVKGYALNERRLRDDPSAANDLAARLRAIRSEEKHVFAQVRDFFKIASTDYDPSSKECRTFYALLQDKCHFAATGHTASQLILTRADYRTPNMGMTTFSGGQPTVSDAKVGKNYLSQDELYVMHIVSEQFLLHVHSKAIRKIRMTMAQLADKFDELLRVGEYAVLVGWKDFERDRANKHAIAEYARYMMRQKKVA